MKERMVKTKGATIPVRVTFPRLMDLLSFKEVHPQNLTAGNLAEIRSVLPDIPPGEESEREAYKLLVLYASGPVLPENALIIQSLAKGRWVRLQTQNGVLRWRRI